MAEPSSPAPFGALLSAITLVAAIVFVAGFSYRWSYYYNFGLYHLAFSLSPNSIATSATELLRRPTNAALSLGLVAGALIALNALLFGAAALANRFSWVGRIGTPLMGLQTAFVVQALRALVLIYAVFAAGNIVGYRTFRQHVVEDRNNPLPRVTVVMPEGAAGLATAVFCDRDDYVTPRFVGDARTLRRLNDEYFGCSQPTRTWRLLFRDADYVYIFATVPGAVGTAVPRPLTLALPRRSDLMIILE